MTPRRTAIAIATLLGAVPASASAQVQAPATESADSGDDTVETEDLLRPGPGRVAVAIEASRSAPIALGVSSESPRRAALTGTFTDERAPLFCRTPCTLYLEPGIRRLVGDVGTAFPWQVDVPVPTTGPTRLRLRGHTVGWSAVGGLMFVLGVSGAIMGPAGIVGGSVIANSRVTVPLLLAGVGAGLAGVGLAVASWFVLRLGEPGVERPSSPARGLTALRLVPWVGGNESSSAGMGLAARFF